MNNGKQTYRYIKEKSILYGQIDEYELSKEEYFILYSFFVTYSMCSTQSAKKRTFGDYGWSTHNIEITNTFGKRENTELGLLLKGILDFDNYYFVFSDKDDLKEKFKKVGLNDGALSDLDNERAVIAKTSEKNKYLKFFYRIRDCLAHGKFLLKLSSANEKMIVMQDDNGNNVTARIVIKLSSLLNFVKVIDRKGLININDIKVNDLVA